MAAAAGSGSAGSRRRARAQVAAAPARRRRLPAGTDPNAGAGDAPPLLHLLAGNPVTAGAMWLLVDTADASALRRLHPLISRAVATVPWCDTTTPVRDVARWRAAFPAVIGGRCTKLVWSNTATLPPTLVELNLWGCAAFYYSLPTLPALVSLDCSYATICNDDVACLPPGLQVLRVRWSLSFAGKAVSFAHLPALRVVDCSGTSICAAAVASLPPSLEELDVSYCPNLERGLTYTHLPALRVFNARDTHVDADTLESLPATLVALDVTLCCLHRTASFAHLPALRVLRCSGTPYNSVGDASVASMPRTLVELQLNRCSSVTAAATLDHLPTLRWLGNADVALSARTIAACRARGCFCPHVAKLRTSARSLLSLALLPDGRLASGDYDGNVHMWDAARGEAAAAVLEVEGQRWMVMALAVLPDSGALATGVHNKDGPAGRVILWNTAVTPPVRGTTVDCGSGVRALAALPDGRLAAGCDDKRVRLVDVAAAAVAATLEGHTDVVNALAVLRDGRLASGSGDKSVRVWVLARRACVAVLTGHIRAVCALAVLRDGRLASGSDDATVRLWELDTGICNVVLTGHAHSVCALAALPDGRLASGSYDATIRLWGPRMATRSTAAAGILDGHKGPVTALAVLRNGRLASACAGDFVQVYQPPPVRA